MITEILKNYKPPKIVISPCAFRNYFSSKQIAESMVKGINKAIPLAEIEYIPLGDGGDGTMEAILKYFDTAKVVSCYACAPLGDKIEARLVIFANKNAFIEMAEISGTKTIHGKLDPWNATSYGTGELIKFALTLDIERIFVGAGGSATIDCGMGALAALGVKFIDEIGNEIFPSPRNFASIYRIDVANLDLRLQETQITIFSDVEIPLQDNVTFFGKQKGVLAEDINKFVNALNKICDLLPTNIISIPWLGAGGGLAGGFKSILGIEVVPGVEGISKLIDFDNRLDNADLIITAEGYLDSSSFRGKTPIYIANLAHLKAIPCIIICGEWDQELFNTLPKNVYITSIIPKMSNFKEILNITPKMIEITCEQLGRLIMLADFNKVIN